MEVVAFLGEQIHHIGEQIHHMAEERHKHREVERHTWWSSLHQTVEMASQVAALEEELDTSVGLQERLVVVAGVPAVVLPFVEAQNASAPLVAPWVVEPVKDLQGGRP